MSVCNDCGASVRPDSYGNVLACDECGAVLCNPCSDGGYGFCTECIEEFEESN